MEIGYSDVVNYWRQKKVSTANQFRRALGEKAISLAYHSGKIENNAVTYADTREIFERDRVTRYTGDLRTLFEISNAKDAFEEMLKSYDAGLPLDKNLLLTLHEQLTKNTYDQTRWEEGERPGSFKRNDYVVGIDEAGAAPEDVAIKLDELLTEIDAYSGDEIIKAAAYFHCKFENIHPFSDGNGRAGRLALNYFLLIRQHPPIIIHEDDRREYFRALEQWDREQDITLMMAFLTAQTIKTWQKTLARSRAVHCDLR